MMRLVCGSAPPTLLSPTIAKSFTSGAASLARSYGVPLLLPRRLDTIELGEPTPYVRRFTDFATDFRTELDAALSLSPDFAAAATWRDACNWDRIAELTMDGYRCAMEHKVVLHGFASLKRKAGRVIAINAQIETI